MPAAVEGGGAGRQMMTERTTLRVRPEMSKIIDSLQSPQTESMGHLRGPIKKKNHPGESGGFIS